MKKNSRRWGRQMQRCDGVVVWWTCGVPALPCGEAKPFRCVLLWYEDEMLQDGSRAPCLLWHVASCFVNWHMLSLWLVCGLRYHVRVAVWLFLDFDYLHGCWKVPHRYTRDYVGSPNKTRPRLARKQNIASEVGPTLQDAFFFPTLREASARQHQARCSAQTGRCKLVCASCSTQVALCKLLCASCSAQVAPASWSLQVALCKLRSLQVALCKLLCASCSVQVALRKLLCASCSRQGALRKLVGASWSAQVALCNLLCASCSAQVAVKCKLHLATPARGPGRNRTRDPPVPGAGARTMRQLPRTSSNNKSRKKP